MSDAVLAAGAGRLEPERPIAVRAGVLREIVTHARETWPNECCGLLIGSSHTIEAVHRAGNLHDSPTRYLVRPEDHFAAIRRARALALEVVGAYHSHPAGRPGPSPIDREEAQPAGFIHVIAGTRRLRRRAGGGRSLEVAGQWIAAWRLVAGNFVQVPLVRVT